MKKIFLILLVSLGFTTLLINTREVHATETITDLSGYTWVANSFDFTNVPAFQNKTMWFYQIKFHSDGQVYNKLMTKDISNGTQPTMHFNDTLAYHYNIAPFFQKEEYKTIHFLSGPDTTDVNLINLFQTTGTLTYDPIIITDLTNYTWYAGQHVSLYIDLTWNLDFTWDEYTFSTFTVASSVYQIQYNSMRVYDVDYGSGWVDEAYRMIHITGGVDATNPVTIEYFIDNGYLSYNPPAPTNSAPVINGPSTINIDLATYLTQGNHIDYILYDKGYTVSDDKDSYDPEDIYFHDSANIPNDRMSILVLGSLKKFDTAGTYTVTISVTDLDNATTTKDITIVVTGVIPPPNEAPKIVGPNVFRRSTNSVMSLSDMKQRYFANDKEDGSLTSSIIIESGTYTNSITQAGTYNAVFKVTDSGGLSHSIDATIIVFDGPQGFYFVDDYLILYPNLNLTVDQIINYVGFTNYTIEDHNYVAQIPGEYNLTFYVDNVEYFYVIEVLEETSVTPEPPIEEPGTETPIETEKDTNRIFYFIGIIVMAVLLLMTIKKRGKK